MINILTNQISGLYYTSIKDRLYCENVHSPSRRAAQYTLYNIFKVVSLAIAPILPHLVEEMYQYLPQKASKTYFSGHHQRLDSYWLNKDLENTMQDILNCRKDMNKIFEGRTLDMDITIKCPENSFKNMKVRSYKNNSLSNLIKCSHITSFSQVVRSSEVYVTKSLEPRDNIQGLK